MPICGKAAHNTDFAVYVAASSVALDGSAVDQLWYTLSLLWASRYAERRDTNGGLSDVSRPVVDSSSSI